MRTSKTIEKEVIHSHEDADGNITEDITKTTSKISIDDEPDFIKIYTKMWMEYNQIPYKYRQLFFSLVCRMTYCKGATGQIVYTLPPLRDEILKECGWNQRDSLVKGLKALCDCNAIRRVGRGVYQINPNYAGRGEWKYNPRLERGGVKDLKAFFEFKDHDVNTQIIWADNGSSDDESNQMRECFEVTKGEDSVISHTKKRGRKKKAVNE